MTDACLETARLSMHELQPVDRALFCGLFTDAETMKFIGPPLRPDKASRAFCAALRINTSRPLRGLILRLVDRHSAQAIGIGSIQQLDLGLHRAEAGLMLNRLGRTRALSVEALTGLLDCAFRLFPIEEAWVQYRIGHLAAERLVMSAGLAPGAPVGADESAERRVWSAFRRSWGHQRLPIKIGEHPCRTSSTYSIG